MGKDLRLGGFESLFGSLGVSGAGHAFAKAAFFDEILFEPPELLVEKVAGQLDQSEATQETPRAPPSSPAPLWPGQSPRRF